MNKLLKVTAEVLLIFTCCISAKAQRYYNIYNACTANLLQVNDSSYIEYNLTRAIVICRNGSNELNVFINIPYYAVDNKTVDNTGFVNTGYQFRLKVNVDVNEILEVLTSAKTFTTHSMLTLNDVSKEVDVSYTPIVSGTEENGNFNVYISIRFNPADFNLNASESKRQFLIQIKNAKVNRI